MFDKLDLIKKYKPITPGFRDKIGVIYKYLSTQKTSFLIFPLKRKKFKNSLGNLVNYNRQFGHKKLYRLVDFKREFSNINGKIIRFEYDPNRTANLALVQYENGTLSYILDLEGLQKSQIITTNNDNPNNINIGDCLKLKYIPLGTIVSNIEKYPYSGAIYLRTAGNYGIVFQKNDLKVKIQFRSGHIKEFDINCRCFIGKIAGFKNKFIKLGKAGINRWKGKRPHVRGVAKNPVDHPHGGGNGKTSGGRPSVSRWGKYTKGVVKTNRRM